MRAFRDMLRKEATAGEIARGVSLIPDIGEWPESSLAQMVAWIGELMPVAYATAATLADVLKKIGDGPVFVFGTAFHFVHLIDAGFSARLPAGSLIVETGGTKGKSRQITREDLYAELAKTFAIDESRIVSEYGMCELASQAYGRETLRFPSWVRTSVLTGPATVATKGRGALIVDDPLRTDVAAPIRTEDLVELFEDGSFKLLGRLESAPLKGCSLLAEDVELGAPAAAASTEFVDAAGSEDRATRFLDLFDRFLADPLAHKALSRELGSDAAATAALEDLAFSAPSTVSEWLAATEKRRTPKHWLLILPENHSLVGIYPAAVAYVLGLALTVRLPRRFEAKTSLVQLFLDALQELPEARIGTVPSSFRVDGREIDAGGVVVYGSDETVAAVRAQLPGKAVQAFGHQAGATVFGRTDVPALVRDALSLGQRGCMATRIALYLGQESETELARLIAEEGARFWDAPLDWRVRVGQDGAAFALEELGFRAHASDVSGAPLVATRVVTLEELAPELLHAAVSRHPFVIPVLIVKAAPTEFALTKSRYPGLSFRDVGEANRPVWDGSHETLTLFSPY